MQRRFATLLNKLLLERPGTSWVDLLSETESRMNSGINIRGHSAYELANDTVVPQSSSNNIHAIPVTVPDPHTSTSNLRTPAQAIEETHFSENLSGPPLATLESIPAHVSDQNAFEDNLAEPPLVTNTLSPAPQTKAIEHNNSETPAAHKNIEIPAPSPNQKPVVTYTAVHNSSAQSSAENGSSPPHSSESTEEKQSDSNEGKQSEPETLIMKEARAAHVTKAKSNIKSWTKKYGTTASKDNS